MLRLFVLVIAKIYHSIVKSLDFFSYGFYTASVYKKKVFNFLYFYEPYWYTEFVVGLFFLCEIFVVLCLFSFCILSVFKLIFLVFVLFFLWLFVGCILLFYKNAIEKRKVLHRFFSTLFFCLESLFNYHKGKIFCFCCAFIFWYFRVMNVHFSFLLKVKYSYERICFYIVCSFCSIVCIFAFVPSFTSAGF